MKKKLIICTFALIMIIGAYGISYYVGRYGVDISYEFEYNTMPTVVANANKEIIITDLTQIYVQEIDLNSRNISEYLIKTPVKYIGMNRQELQDELAKEMDTVTLEERVKGLISIELNSFEKYKVIIRKSYSDSAMKQDYYLYERDGVVVIYLGDKKTFYDYTDISYESLDRATQYFIDRGMYIKDSTKLYEFLQNHTS